MEHKTKLKSLVFLVLLFGMLSMGSVSATLAGCDPGAGVCIETFDVSHISNGWVEREMPSCDQEDWWRSSGRLQGNPWDCEQTSYYNDASAFTWTDYEIVVPGLQIAEGSFEDDVGWAGIIFRVQVTALYAPFNFYFAMMSPYHNELRVGKYIDGTYMLLDSKPFNVGAGTYKFQVEVIDNEIKVYIDDNLELDVIDPANTFPTGSVGINVDSSVAQAGVEAWQVAWFDEVRVNFIPFGIPISTCQQLDNIDTDAEISQDYYLTQDIDCSGISDFSAIYGGSGGWGFTGIFDGGGHVITGVQRVYDGHGFFDTLGNGGVIRNLGLIVDNNFNMDGPCFDGEEKGALTGSVRSGGLISNSYVSGTLYLECDIAGEIGAFAGRNSGTILNSYTDLDFIYYDAEDGFGGSLAGYNTGGTIEDSYAKGSISSTSGVENLGGLVGVNSGGTITNSYSTASVSNTGGGNSAGGLVNLNTGGGTITNSYSTGFVNGISKGGFVVFGTCTNNINFWDTGTSGTFTSSCGTGKTTAQMKQQATFESVGWDFTNVWQISEGTSYPCLQWDGSCLMAESFIDIGLRAYDGTGTISIAADPLGTLTSPLRIAKNGDIYGIVLVDPLDPDASGIRIWTSSGIKALREI